MNEDVNDKIDIDILKERPLHDVLASIRVEIGFCHAVSPVQQYSIDPDAQSEHGSLVPQSPYVWHIPHSQV